MGRKFSIFPSISGPCTQGYATPYKSSHSREVVIDQNLSKHQSISLKSTPLTFSPPASIKIDLIFEYKQIYMLNFTDKYNIYT